MIPSVKWYMGQPLLPVHLEASQEAVRSESFSIINNTGVPYYGIQQLKVDKTFLELEVLRIREFKYVSLTGQLIELGVNADVLDLDLSESQENKVEIFLNVYDNEIEYEFRKELIKCHAFSLKPSFREDPSARFFIKLLTLENSLDKKWKVSNDFLPVLVSLNSTVSTGLIDNISELIKKIIISYENMNKDKDFILKTVEFKPVLSSTYELKFKLDNIRSGVNVHPCYLYELLHKLYINAALFFNILPEEISIYKHNKLYEIFNTLINKIDELITHKSKSVKFVRFVETDGMFRADDLDLQILHSKNLYFVVQKKNKEQAFDISRLKIASSVRANTINKLALPGIASEYAEKVPFRHYLSDNCLFYKLALGTEWDYVIRDKSIVFFNKDEYQNMKFYLYYY